MDPTVALHAIRGLYAAVAAPTALPAPAPGASASRASAPGAPCGSLTRPDTTRPTVGVDGASAGMGACEADTGPDALVWCAARGVQAPQLWDLVEACQQVMNAAAACQAVAIAHAAAQELDYAEDGTEVWSYRGVGQPSEDCSDIAAPRLGVSEQVAGRRVEDAIDQVTRTPTLITAMAAGQLNVFTAGVVTDELRDASPAVAAAIVDDLHRTGHLGATTPGPLRRRARRLLGRLDPDVLAARATSERARRGLSRSFESAATDRWVGIIPTETSRPAWAAIETLAEKLLAEGTCQSITQARADALTSLILAQTTATIHLHLTTPHPLPDDTTDTDHTTPTDPAPPEPDQHHSSHPADTDPASPEPDQHASTGSDQAHPDQLDPTGTDRTSSTTADHRRATTGTRTDSTHAGDDTTGTSDDTADAQSQVRDEASATEDRDHPNHHATPAPPAPTPAVPSRQAPEPAPSRQAPTPRQPAASASPPEQPVEPAPASASPPEQPAEPAPSSASPPRPSSTGWDPDQPCPLGTWIEVGGFEGPGTCLIPAAWLISLPTRPTPGAAGFARAHLVTSWPLGCHPTTGAIHTGLVSNRPPTTATTPDTLTSPDIHPGYRPPPRMRALILLRDGHCRFPGCTQPARVLDLDHVTPWPAGPTHPDNLLGLCRHHHRVKQRPGWTLTLHPDATTTWTDPTGRRHYSDPTDHLHHTTPLPDLPDHARTHLVLPTPAILAERTPFRWIPDLPSTLTTHPTDEDRARILFTHGHATADGTRPDHGHYNPTTGTIDLTHHYYTALHNLLSDHHRMPNRHTNPTNPHPWTTHNNTPAPGTRWGDDPKYDNPPF